MKGLVKFLLAFTAVFTAVVGALVVFDRFTNKHRIKGDYLKCDLEESEEQ